MIFSGEVLMIKPLCIKRWISVFWSTFDKPTWKDMLLEDEVRCPWLPNHGLPFNDFNNNNNKFKAVVE